MFCIFLQLLLQFQALLLRLKCGLPLRRELLGTPELILHLFHPSLCIPFEHVIRFAFLQSKGSFVSAALLFDLKQRGLLDDTLVMWTGEFGREPETQILDGKETIGRDHNASGYTAWLAGGGVRGGLTHGGTDELGYKAVWGEVHLHDLHATMLHLLGLDHTRLVYRYGGRDFRLTNVHGNVIQEIIA